MFFTPHINYIHKHCAGLITRISRYIFPSLGLGQLQSSLHEGSKQAVRSSMLGLLSPIKHHIRSHEPKKTPTCLKKTKRSSNYPYLRENSLVFEKKLKFFGSCWLFQRSLPEMGTVLSINHNSQKQKSTLYQDRCILEIAPNYFPTSCWYIAGW